MLTRGDLELREDELLAPWATKSRDSRGRVHEEPEHVFRSCYQRDRDRIIHCTAFRRLEYKTQVFVNHEGDDYRTRLTHTLEVAQIARTIARALRLNEDLVEAIALAHDLGHPPFGHAGEDALGELMQGHGGFDHNRQGLRVVEYLEERYPGFRGLNLTWEVREGINKHMAPRDRAGALGEGVAGPHPNVEAQVADRADEIAYDHHDLDDGLTSGLLQEVELSAIPLWAEEAEQARALPMTLRKYQVIRALINRQVTDVVTTSLQRLKAWRIESPDEARRAPERVIAMSAEMSAARAPLRAFLMARLYRHYRVVRMSTKAQRFIRELFGAYLGTADQLPEEWRRRLAGEDAHQVVCDYIAGMTDRYALNEYQKLFDPYERV